MKAAEIALLTAKKQGRNRVVIGPDEKISMNTHGLCSTVVGNSLRGDCGDGAYAYEAPIKEPYGLDSHKSLGLLFVDRSNHKIRSVFNNQIFNIAGNGKSGYSGDGGSPGSAMLCKPSGVAVHEPTGDIYIADTGNHCIRKISGGIIVTAAGNGSAGYTGDGADAVKACLKRPGGVAVDDNGNVYTNDYGNNVIRRISPEGIIHTVAGNGSYGCGGDGGPAVSAQLNKPYGLGVSKDGRWLYIADYENNRIRRVNMENGIIRTICGAGTIKYGAECVEASRACLINPYWVTPYGDYLFIADHHRVSVMDLKQNTVRTLVGSCKPGYIDSEISLSQARLCIPAGMAVHGGSLYIADYGNNAIRKVNGAECFGG